MNNPMNDNNNHDFLSDFPNVLSVSAYDFFGSPDFDLAATAPNNTNTTTNTATTTATIIDNSAVGASLPICAMPLPLAGVAMPMFPIVAPSEAMHAFTASLTTMALSAPPAIAGFSPQCCLPVMSPAGATHLQPTTLPGDGFLTSMPFSALPANTLSADSTCADLAGVLAESGAWIAPLDAVANVVPSGGPDAATDFTEDALLQLLFSDDALMAALPAALADHQPASVDDAPSDMPALERVPPVATVPEPSSPVFTTLPPLSPPSPMAAAMATSPPDSPLPADVNVEQQQPPPAKRPRKRGAKELPPTSVVQGSLVIPTRTKKSRSNVPGIPEVLAYPASMIPHDAPIQKRGGVPKKRPREYDNEVRVASAMAGAAVAAVAADDQDAATEADPPLDEAEAKRRSNALSARRSRARKLAKIEFLEQRVLELEARNAELEARLAQAGV